LIDCCLTSTVKYSTHIQDENLLNNIYILYRNEGGIGGKSGE
jgi:hypothetical protein